MKIVLIHGQNHKGSTYHISRILINSIHNDKDIAEFFLPNDLPHFCTGCYTCIKDESKCPYFYEKNAIMQKIENADLLIFTTPTYCMAPSAPMKNFMDLSFTYWMPHKPRKCMFTKRAVVISTAAGAGTKHATRPIAHMLSYWGISNVIKYGICVQAMSWNDVSSVKKEKITKDMKKLGHTLSNKKLPHVSIKTKFLFTIMAAMHKNNMGSGIEEKQYWQKAGWLGKERPWKNK